MQYNGFFSLQMNQSDAVHHHAEIRTLFSLGVYISALILPHFHLFHGRITSCLASSPSITPARSTRCRDESVLSTFQLLRQIPPGATRVPVIASSKLRYACTLAHMKEREVKAVSRRERESEHLTQRDLKCQVSVGSSVSIFLSNLKLLITTQWKTLF